MVAELGPEGAAGESTAAAETAPQASRRAPTTKQINDMIRALVLRRLQQMTETPMEDGEQEQKLLDIISRNMGKLEDLDRARRATQATAPRRPSKALLDLRRRIADRIDQLNQG